MIARNPLLTALKAKGWVQGVRSQSPDFIGCFRMSIGLHRVSYLVTTYGVPLRIQNDPELLEPEVNSQRFFRLIAAQWI